MNTRSVLVITFSWLLSGSLSIVRAEDSTSELQPLLAQPDQMVLKNDFSSAEQLKREHWKPNMGTRWTIVDGVLRGIPSSPEFQAAKKDHQGFEPRISVPVTPAEFIARFSVRFSGGSETVIAPFVEFGHHVARVKFSADSVFLLADGDSLKVAEAKAFRYEPGKWYHALAELKGEEFIIQFAGGPTLYAKHPSYGQPPPSGGNGLGIAGPKDGAVDIDNVIISTIKPLEQPAWAAKRDGLPKFQPVTVKEKKFKSAKASDEE